MARNDAFVLSLAPHLLPKKPQFLAFRHASCLHRRIRLSPRNGRRRRQCQSQCAGPINTTLN
jgi:hypothetical protein